MAVSGLFMHKDAIIDYIIYIKHTWFRIMNHPMIRPKMLFVGCYLIGFVRSVKCSVNAELYYWNRLGLFIRLCGSCTTYYKVARLLPLTHSMIFQRFGVIFYWLLI